MAEVDVLAEHKVQDYIDGRLSERDRANVAAYLLAHPDLASEVEAVRRQNEALKGIGQDILDEPVPERLRSVLRQKPAPGLASRAWRSTPFLQAAAAILLFCVGGTAGWLLHDQWNPRLSAEDLIAASAANVYAFYSTDRGYPLDFPPDRTEDLLGWIGRSFEREIGPPDLADFSYEYRGGRLLPISGANSGLFEFENSDGARLAVFFWPAERAPTRVDRMGRQENIAARYWLNDGMSFAVMSEESNSDLENAAERIFTYYDETFGSG